MGFAVVADEVRTLAQRSAQAAQDTASLIEASIASTSQGQQRVTRVVASVSAITASVDKVKGLVDDVSSSTKEQAEGIDQVAEAVSRIEKVTQQTAATAEESAAASEELNAQAETALAEVARVEVIIGGANRQQSAASPTTRWWTTTRRFRCRRRPTGRGCAPWIASRATPARSGSSKVGSASFPGRVRFRPGAG
jgi:methyl-accepting chemotaxis protein/methyl-accepting chemotaxis protein-1 (serine sensor receptor)